MFSIAIIAIVIITGVVGVYMISPQTFSSISLPSYDTSPSQQESQPEQVQQETGTEESSGDDSSYDPFTLTLENQVDDGIDMVMEDMLGEIEVPEDNPIGTTQQEADSLRHSGSQFLKDLARLFGSGHDMSQDVVQVVSPFDIDPRLLFFIGIGMVGVLAWSLVRKIGLHIVYMVAAALVIVIVFMVMRIDSGTVT